MLGDYTTIGIMFQSNSKDHLTGLRKPVWNGHPFFNERISAKNPCLGREAASSDVVQRGSGILGIPIMYKLQSAQTFTRSLPTTPDSMIPLPSANLLKPNAHRMVFRGEDFRRHQSHGSKISVPIKGR